jgi:type I restriction enzyme M protein
MRRRNTTKAELIMAKTRKPTNQPSLAFLPAADALHQEGNWLWIPLRKEWRDLTSSPA